MNKNFTIPFYAIIKKSDDKHIEYIDTDTLKETTICGKSFIYKKERAEEILASLSNSDDYEIVVGYLFIPNTNEGGSGTFEWLGKCE